MDIAGSTCAVCGQHVVLAREGKRCSTCSIVVHRACDTQSQCSRCGRVYESQEQPVVDPLREAIVPRSLRPSRPGSPVAMAVIGVFLLFALFVLLLLWVHH
jgi:hypothetical protein